MILVDSALARRVADGRPPIRVGMIGAGFMASGVLLQISTVHREAISVLAIANRKPERAGAI
jgi:predicted homoserine dehydrogenase-like protein